MRYSDSQKSAVGEHLRNRFMEGDIEGHEIVVALISMVEAAHLDLDDVAPILMNVFLDNPKGALTALERAYSLIDDEMVNSIIKEVQGQ